jgi:hypothetical protein
LPLWENISELIEQAAAYSGAADEELAARRIAEQEAQLELLTRRRDELAQQKSRRLGMNIKQHMEVIGADGVRHRDRRSRRGRQDQVRQKPTAAKDTTGVTTISSISVWSPRSKGRRCACRRMQPSRLPWKKNARESPPEPVGRSASPAGRDSLFCNGISAFGSAPAAFFQKSMSICPCLVRLSS